MELAELIMTRRTVHNYTPEKPPRELVERALELSLWVPNHKLTFPWVYSWVGPQAAVHLADLSVELKQAKESTPLSSVKVAALRAVFLNPQVVSLGLKRTGDQRRDHEDYATLGCSVQTAQLFLWSHGIASKWSTGGNTTHPKTYEILGLDPEKVRLEGALLIGYPQVTPAAEQRPALRKVLRQVE